LSLQYRIKHTLSLDMVAKPTNACKQLRVSYKHSTSPTCFGHTSGHLQGNAFVGCLSVSNQLDGWSRII